MPVTVKTRQLDCLPWNVSLSGLDVPLQALVVLLTHAAWDKHRKRLTEHLCSRVTEDLLGTGVDKRNDAAVVYRDDGVRGRFGQRSKLCLALLQGPFRLLSFGDVSGDTLYSDRGSIFLYGGTVDLESQPLAFFRDAIHLVARLLGAGDLLLQVLARSREMVRGGNLPHVHFRSFLT